MKRKYGALFAMGDVLVDTKAQYEVIWKRLGDKYGAETDYLEAAVKEKNIYTILNKYFSHLSDNEKNSLVNELEEFEAKMKFPEIPGANKFLKELKENGVKTGVVTGFNDRQIDDIYKKTKLNDYMDTTVTADRVDHIKPDPSGFLIAAKDLGIDPKDCVVFEDSFAGIEAAKKAGMNVIALSTTNNPQALKNITSKVIPDFSNFSVSDLDKLYEGENKVPVKEKKSNSWVIILLLLLAILALFFLWRSCNSPKTEPVAITSEVIENETPEISGPAIEPIDVERVTTIVALPDGVKLNAYEDGIESKMVAFLNSDEYKNAKEDQLKDRWFDFDNIDFLHGSSTELTEGSYPQLDNISEILKHYKATKVKIGGYTDKTGNPEVNKKISEERANTIKAYLVQKGIDAKTISTEGYGEEFAKYPADAPDSDRVHDRKISLRFVK